MQKKQPLSLLQNGASWGPNIIWEPGGSGTTSCALLELLTIPVLTQPLSKALIIPHNSPPLPWKIVCPSSVTQHFAHYTPSRAYLQHTLPIGVSLCQGSGLWKVQRALRAGGGWSAYTKGPLCACGSEGAQCFPAVF